MTTGGRAVLGKDGPRVSPAPLLGGTAGSRSRLVPAVASTTRWALTYLACLTAAGVWTARAFNTQSLTALAVGAVFVVAAVRSLRRAA